MKLLAIETSATACSVALSVGEEVFALHKVAPMQQAQMVLPMIDEILRDAGLVMQDLSALAFGQGPGSFTGVRIAASVMQGLAFATGLPLIPVSSLAATAQAAYRDLGWEKLFVVLDARMQEVYWGRYKVNEKGLVELIGEEMLTVPEAVAGEAGWKGVGSGWAFSERIPVRVEEQDETRLPTAKGVLELARGKFLKQEWVALDEALPVYLRDNVAKKKKI